MTSEKERLKQWQYNLIGVGASTLLLILIYFNYETIVYTTTFGSTNDKTMSFIIRYMDKIGGPVYVYGFITFFILFFGISAIRGYQKDKTGNSKLISENKPNEKPDLTLNAEKQRHKKSVSPEHHD